MNNYLNEQKDFLLNNIVKNLKNIHNKKELREIVIHEINRFITLGVSREDKYTGSLYVLTALAIVSPEVSNSMSWLIQ